MAVIEHPASRVRPGDSLVGMRPHTTPTSFSPKASGRLPGPVVHPTVDMPGNRIIAGPRWLGGPGNQ